MPSMDQKEKIRDQFEILSTPDFLVMKNVESTDLPKCSMVTSKREIQLQTQRRMIFLRLRTDGTETNYTETLKPPSDGTVPAHRL